MAAIASILNARGRPATDLVLKFLEHFALISDALESQDLWDEEDGFFYDRLRLADGSVDRDRGAVDRRHPAAARRRGDRRGGRRPRGDGEQARRRAAAARPHPARGGPGDRRACSSASSASSRVLRAARARVRRVGVPLAVRAARRVALARRPPVRARRRRHVVADRLRARRVDHRHVRRQLELARAGLDAGQLPRRRGARPLCALLRRRPEGRVSDRARARS